MGESDSDGSLFERVKDGAASAGEAVRESVSSISILPPAERCPHCGREMNPTYTYDPKMYEEMASWECPDCDYAEYRDDEPLGM